MIRKKNRIFAKKYKLLENNINSMEKKDLLKEEIQHFDIKKVDATEIINSMRGMSFTSRDTATATDI